MHRPGWWAESCGLIHYRRWERALLRIRRWMEAVYWKVSASTACLLEYLSWSIRFKTLLNIVRYWALLDIVRYWAFPGIIPYSSCTLTFFDGYEFILPFAIILYLPVQLFVHYFGHLLISDWYLLITVYKGLRQSRDVYEIVLTFREMITNKTFVNIQKQYTVECSKRN